MNRSTFHRYQKLGYVDLSQTSLTDFDFDHFENLTKMVGLHIANNNFKEFNATILSKTLKQLTMTFKISGNNLENVKDVIPHLNSDVRNLDLSGNYVGHIGLDTFKGFRELSHLDLKRTHLMEFDIKTIPVELLDTIDISFNNLTRVDFSSDQPIPYLYALNIEGNELTELNGINQLTYPKLKVLNIQGNPVSCEYIDNLRWKGLKIIGEPCKEMNRK